MGRRYLPFLIAGIATLPGLAMRFCGLHASPPATALISGAAILGASFLLLWACDAAQADVSQSLALAAVALIAVLPEYAVDMYFTWQAGKHPASDYAQYAVANMTGANRLLIGVAWGAIAGVYWLRYGGHVRVGKDRRTEMFFLGLATVYAFVVPLKGTLAWYDGFVFLGIYAWYLIVAGKRPAGEGEAEGPAELIVRLPKAKRRATTLALFLFAGGAILANAAPFCEGLLGTGRRLHINEFVLVQWLAPIASEAPEFVVALVFAWRGQSGMALGSLLSSKLNQWTLLVGMIPGVYALSHGAVDHPMPMGHFQMNEILLTAAQSLLAVVLLASLRLSISGGLLLLGLFVGQLVMPGIVVRHPQAALGIKPEHVHVLFSVLYLVAAASIFLQRPRHVWALRRGMRVTEPPAPEMTPRTADEERPNDPTIDIKTKYCVKCRWRLFAVAAVKNGRERACDGECEEK